MKCDVKCSMDFFGRVVDGDPAVTQDFSPTPPFISAVAIPLAQREVEEKLMRVGLAALEVSRDGHDFDGADIQEMSERLGVIARVTMAEPCHPEHCICAEVSDFPVECLRDTPVLAALRELIARDYYSPYHKALVAAAHLPPDPVEEAFEAYREAVVAYAAYESTGRDIYWEHLRPAIAARRALDAAILGEAA